MLNPQFCEVSKIISYLFISVELMPWNQCTLEDAAGKANKMYSLFQQSAPKVTNFE
jgi:hypothetical protein